jgi:peptidoglycan hydrolase-like protein with peptidoglycan-binding domain
LQQLLAELGYLALAWQPSRPVATSLAAQLTAAVSPPAGQFSWRYPQLRAMLGSLWQPGQYSVLVQGAVMAFEADHGLSTDGVVDGQVWADLLRAAVRRQVDRQPYDYIEVSKASPETLSVWRRGRIVYTTPCNTGIAARPTADGTFPVYARYLSTTMSGTNPDGSPYSDPGVPYVAYFNGGDAVHGFLRGGYGYPQSLGCVELPYSAASVVFTYDPIGTLVGVS